MNNQDYLKDFSDQLVLSFHPKFPLYMTFLHSVNNSVLMRIKENQMNTTSMLFKIVLSTLLLKKIKMKMD